MGVDTGEGGGSIGLCVLMYCYSTVFNDQHLQYHVGLVFLPGVKVNGLLLKLSELSTRVQLYSSYGTETEILQDVLMNVTITLPLHEAETLSTSSSQVRFIQL